MARIIMVIVFVTALFFMFDLLNKSTPELRSILPDTTTSGGAKAQTPFKWEAHEDPASDGKKNLDLALTASRGETAGPRPTLHLVCYAGNAYAYLYPVSGLDRVTRATFNGSRVSIKADQGRLFILNPAPLDLAQILSGIPVLQVQLGYGDKTAKYVFETAGLALYQPYLTTDCPGAVVAQGAH